MYDTSGGYSEEEWSQAKELVGTSKFQKGIGSEVLVGLDAIALYPSIGEEVAKEMYESLHINKTFIR